MRHAFEQRQPILTQIRVDREPIDLLTRFFVKAVDAAARRGVRLEFGTFEELRAVNEANADSWPPLTTSFRPDIGGVDESNGFVILGRDANGDTVATQAARFFDWSHTNFQTEAEALRFFYDDPERDKGIGEQCIVSAPDAHEVTGRVVLGGGIWYRPDYRGLKLGEIIPRISRANAFLRWGFDEFIAIVTKANVDKAFDRRAGFRKVSRSIILRNHPTIPNGDLEVMLARVEPAQLIDDLFGFIVDFRPEVDPRVDARRA
ncbi:MAG: hypothetical protein ACR2OV_18200 [Hyphomicrobiaceae bacterium]